MFEKHHSGPLTKVGWQRDSIYAEVERWREGVLTQVDRWVGAPLTKVGDTRQQMGFKKIWSLFQAQWLEMLIGD